MSRGRPWLVEEDIYVIENAGLRSPSEIAAGISLISGRRYTPKAVTERIYHLNRRHGLKLTSAVIWRWWVCDCCCKEVYEPLDADGWCESCRMDAALASYRDRIREEEVCAKRMAACSTDEEREAVRSEQLARNREVLSEQRREAARLGGILRAWRIKNGTSPQRRVAK